MTPVTIIDLSEEFAISSMEINGRLPTDRAWDDFYDALPPCELCSATPTTLLVQGDRKQHRCDKHAFILLPQEGTG